MHACGHDLHTSMLVGAAKLLSSMRDDIAGNVVFMFQPGEEGHAGARSMLEEGLLDSSGDRPTGAFAIHVSPWFASGTVNHRPGPAMASADEVRIAISGRGGHASTPYLSLDPVPIAAEIVLAVQTAITRRINVFDPGVITFGSIQAGTTNNVIPEQAHLIGPIRRFAPFLRRRERNSMPFSSGSQPTLQQHIRRRRPSTSSPVTRCRSTIPSSLHS